MAGEKHGVAARFEIAGEAFDVVEATIAERLDEVGRLTIELARDGALPRPATLLSAEASFELFAIDSPSVPRRFRGIVTRAERRADVRGRPTLRVVVEPKLARARFRDGSRTYQHQSSVDAVRDALGRAGAEKLRVAVSDPIPKRDYLVQYRESDLAFVQRVLAEDGVAFVVDHTTDTPELVLFDDAAGLGEAPDAELPFRPDFGFDLPLACITRLRRTGGVRADKVTLRDYDFARPRLDLTSTKEGKDEGGHTLELYEFPARTNDKDELDRRAQLLLDAEQSRRDVLFAESTSYGLAPGRRFRVVEHPAADVNVEYLATATTLRYVDRRTGTGTAGSSASVEIEAIPTAKSRYRPARKPRAQRIAGPQLAVTTGPSGQEIHVDAQGRVKGRFLWDREAPDDDTSSLWMRTAQVPLGGSMLLPRVGWEVLVSNAEGDPDLPLVVGRLTNAETPPPYALPKGAARSAIQTATSPGGGSSNELRTDDSRGREEMFLNASKDMTVDVLNNTTEYVGNDATLQVGANQSIAVTNSLDVVIGADQTLDVGGNRSATISTFLVDECTNHALTVAGNRDQKIGGDHKFTISGDASLEVGAIDTTLVVGKVSETIEGDVTRTIGAADVAITAGDLPRAVTANLTRTIAALDGVVTFGGKSVEAGVNITETVGGAVLAKVDGDHAEDAAVAFTEIDGGANLVKADTIVFEAGAMLNVVMGGSILSINPGMVTLIGTSIKLDGDTSDLVALVIDN